MWNLTKEWAKAALIRAARTFAQGVLGYIGGSATILGDVDWIAALSAGVFAAIVSMLMSCAGLPEVEEGGDA